MLIEAFYVALFLIVVLLVTWYYYFWFIFVKKLQKLPYKATWPILGNALDVMPLTDMLKTLMKFRTLGKTYKMIALFEVSIHTSDQKFIEYLTTSKNFITKSLEYDYLAPWLNEGLLTSTGKKWFQRRKLLTPSFHFNILEEFVKIFNNCGDILIDKLLNEIDKDETDIYPYITLYALDVIYESTMGVQINAQTKEDSEYVQMVKLETKLIMERVIVIWKKINLLFHMTGGYLLEKRTIEALHKATNDVIMARRDLLMKKNEHDADVERRKCFLDILLESTIDGKPLSNSDIREEVDTFLFEGHDTTSSAIGFALYELSINPDIQAKVLDELKSIYGKDKKCDVTMNNLQEMKYLEMVIKETLRKYPAVPIIGRKCDHDIEYDGMKIPKGSTVGIVPYVLHREEDTFPDPEKFDPERFSVENRGKIGPYAYIPFSAGFRNCIGQKFAMMELKSVLSKIIRNFEIMPVENYEPKMMCELILRSENGIKMKLRRRN